MERLVNRRDVWGQYSLLLAPHEAREQGRSYKAMTLPIASMRGQDMVTLDKLTRHFASRRQHRPQLIGLHAESKEGTSRWLAIDIDNHDLEAVGGPRAGPPQPGGGTGVVAPAGGAGLRLAVVTDAVSRKKPSAAIHQTGNLGLGDALNVLVRNCINFSILIGARALEATICKISACL